MRRAARRDPGERAIIDALRHCGALVAQLDGENLPDLLVIFRSAVHLLEVKAPAGPRGGTSSKGQRLRPGQQSIRDAARARGVEIHTVTNVDQALAAVGADFVPSRTFVR